MLTPDSENGLVRRMGSAAPVSDRREESEFDANSAMNVDDVDIIDVDDDDSDADGGRLVAQVTAVNVLSQVQRMQDEIKELNEQIEEENMKAKLKDLKKSMMEPEGKSFESSNINTFYLSEIISKNCKIKIVFFSDLKSSFFF